MHVRSIYSVLQVQKLYGKLAKCSFCVPKNIFLGYVVSEHGIEVDYEQVKAIKT